MNRIYRGMVEASVQRALSAGGAVADCDHPGVLGRAREIFVNELLAPLLYPTMGICTGLIIDGDGGQSRQTDVIVFDKRVVPPLLLQPGEAFVPCESVLFAIEVKSQITRQNLIDSAEWAGGVKALRFDRAVATLGAVSSIACAVFAFNTDLAAANTIVDEERRLREIVAMQRLHVPLSALTVATRGHAECIAANEDPPRWATFANSSATPTEGVVRFLSWLNRHAPALSEERATISLSGYLH